MLPTHDVACPKCGGPLYTALSLEDVRAAGAAGTPQIRRDESGDYLPCPHCSARIAMKRIETRAGPGFRIADP